MADSSLNSDTLGRGNERWGQCTAAVLTAWWEILVPYAKTWGTSTASLVACIHIHLLLVAFCRVLMKEPTKEDFLKKKVFIFPLRMWPSAWGLEAPWLYRACLQSHMDLLFHRNVWLMSISGRYIASINFQMFWNICFKIERQGINVFKVC